MPLISNMHRYLPSKQRPPDASITNLAAIVVTALIAASNVAPSNQCEPDVDSMVLTINAFLCYSFKIEGYASSPFSK